PEPLRPSVPRACRRDPEQLPMVDALMVSFPGMVASGKGVLPPALKTAKRFYRRQAGARTWDGPNPVSTFVLIPKWKFTYVPQAGGAAHARRKRRRPDRLPAANVLRGRLA